MFNEWGFVLKQFVETTLQGVSVCLERKRQEAGEVINQWLHFQETHLSPFLLDSFHPLQQC